MVSFFIALANLAHGKSTAQSSIKNRGSSSRAVDGNKNTTWHAKSCTMTESTPDPWWRVDLERTAVIYSVNITNRGNRCCEHRLSDFNLRIGDSLINNGNSNPICGANLRIEGLGVTSRFRCNTLMCGRYLNIQSNIQVILTLCEVEVFGRYEN